MKRVGKKGEHRNKKGSGGTHFRACDKLQESWEAR